MTCSPSFWCRWRSRSTPSFWCRWRSRSTPAVLLLFKLVQFTPLLKKPGHDKDTPGNYRPISNLNNISKMLELLILKRIQSHTTSSGNFNPFQSAYRRYFSTEFALLLALDYIYITQLIQAHRLYLYHWTLVKPLTLMNISSSSIDYKTALVLPA